MNKPNKKIINATPKLYDGINFKSLMEVSAYKKFKQAGFDVKYEPTKYTLMEGFKSKVPYYDKAVKSKRAVNRDNNLKESKRKIRSITYTPDFEIRYNDIIAIIEVKGFENDCFPIKKKLFLKYLATLEGNYVYFEVYSVKNVLQTIEIIKNYDKES